MFVSVYINSLSGYGKDSEQAQKLYVIILSSTCSNFTIRKKCQQGNINETENECVLIMTCKAMKYS